MMYSMIQNSDFILKTINGSSYLLPTGQDGLRHMLSIAGLTFSLYGENTSFSPALLPFATNTVFAFPNRTVLVLAGTPASAGNGKVLLHNKELIEKDASFFCIYCIPSEKGSLQDVLFHVLRYLRHFRHRFPSSGRYCVPEAGYFRFCRRTLPGRADFVPDKPLITPSWTPALFEKNLFFAQKLASLTSLCRLHCTPTSHAVEVMKEYVDGWMGG